ncbi:hypothetical protein EDC04DRAFT_2639569, partial [Pisolithus marmoratus]
MVRPSQRLFPVLRSGLRANLVARPVPRSPVGRRTASSHASHSDGGDEKYWRTFPASFYIFSHPQQRKTAHKHTVEHIHEVEPVSAKAAHTDEPPMTDDEGAVVSGGEIKESIERAIAEDSPTHTQAREEEVTLSPSGSPSQSEFASEGDKDVDPEHDSDKSQEFNPGPTETETVSTAGVEDSQKEAPEAAENETEKPNLDHAAQSRATGH